MLVHSSKSGDFWPKIQRGRRRLLVQISKGEDCSYKGQAGGRGSVRRLEYKKIIRLLKPSKAISHSDWAVCVKKASFMAVK